MTGALAINFTVTAYNHFPTGHTAHFPPPNEQRLTEATNWSLGMLNSSLSLYSWRSHYHSGSFTFSGKCKSVLFFLYFWLGWGLELNFQPQKASKEGIYQNIETNHWMRYVSQRKLIYCIAYLVTFITLSKNKNPQNGRFTHHLWGTARKHNNGRECVNQVHSRTKSKAGDAPEDLLKTGAFCFCF